MFRGIFCFHFWMFIDLTFHPKMDDYYTGALIIQKLDVSCLPKVDDIC